MGTDNLSPSSSYAMKNSNWRHAELLNHWIKQHVILSSIAILILIEDAMDTEKLRHLMICKVQNGASLFFYNGI